MEDGFALSRSTPNLTFVTWPPLVDFAKVDDLERMDHISIREDSSSTIFCSGSEPEVTRGALRIASSYFQALSIYLCVTFDT